jgi:hypothetical protein
MTWNDINEIQPDDYQNVLFYCFGGKYYVGMYYGKDFCENIPEQHPMYKRGEDVFGKYGRYAQPAGDHYVVTHWMYLPEKPEGVV